MAASPAASASAISPLECSDSMTLVSPAGVSSDDLRGAVRRPQHLQAGGAVRRYRFQQGAR